MKRSLRTALALLLAFTVPAAVLARPSGGGGRPSGGGGHAAPAARPAPARPAPAPARPAPAQPQHPSGFSFPHDQGPAPRPAVPPGGHVVVKPPARPVVRALPPNYASQHWPVVANPHHWGGWGWNHGYPWAPAYNYWGWGFWGPFAIGAFTGFVLFGAVSDGDYVYDSYEVEPTSPGAQLLQNYGLTQTQCGPPNLVVMWGPDNSVICAYPNNLVSPGEYDIDTETLTLVSPPQQ